jgi:hypothetical protein
MVMELVDGRSLRTMLDRGPIPLPHARRIGGAKSSMQSPQRTRKELFIATSSRQT